MFSPSKVLSQYDQQERVLFFMKVGGLSADVLIGIFAVVLLITGQLRVGLVLLVYAVIGVPLTYLMTARRRKVMFAQQSAEARRKLQ